MEFHQSQPIDETQLKVTSAQSPFPDSQLCSSPSSNETMCTEVQLPISQSHTVTPTVANNEEVECTGPGLWPQVIDRTEMDPVYKCPACNLILNRPVQLKCGHRQCHFCRRSAETEAIICSTCHEETSVEDIIIDELLIQEINELPIICPLCTWSGSYRNYKEHIETTHPWKCNKCSATFTIVERLIQHQQLECPATFVKCPLYSYGCEQLFPLNETRAHTISDVHIDALRYAWNCCMCTIETAREDMKNNYHHSEASISSINNEELEKLYSNIQILTELLCDLNSSKSTSHSSHDTDPYASINNDICINDYFTQHENLTMNFNPNDSDNLTSLSQHSAYNNHRMDELKDDIQRLSENQPTNDLNGNVQSQETPSTNERCQQNREVNIM
ncbi:unnamed protein product [Rotaria sordida]|uniref:Uncharacterized protein n=1 Tax=Rotaria sordida TaxID=392033 RepID=A0A815PSN3_9BILA|nr:unnamed protein product [Rotaria sordida]